MSPIPAELATAKKNFFSTCIADICRAIEGDSLVGAFTLICCAIGALAEIQYLADGSPPAFMHDNAKYREWVRRWIKVPINANCDPQHLYGVRCALAHTHGASRALRGAGFSGYAFTHDDPARHWTIDGQRPNHVLVLNLETLLAELSLATWNFFDNVVVPVAAEPAVVQELQDLMSVVSTAPGGGARFIDTRDYADIHKALARWDHPTPTINALEADIVGLYQRRRAALPGTGAGGLAVTLVPTATGGGHHGFPEITNPTIFTNSSRSASLKNKVIECLVAFLSSLKDQ